MRVIGLAGWSGAGKTTLLVRLIPALRGRGLSVSTVKHAHHAFEIDQPGKDSFVHRQAGASEVLVASSSRFALIHELRGAAEPPLADLLERLSPVDLVLVEGFKASPHPKIEVHRAANGRARLLGEVPGIVALASDRGSDAGELPFAPLDDIPGVADLVCAHASAIGDVLALLRANAGS